MATSDATTQQSALRERLAKCRRSPSACFLAALKRIWFALLDYWFIPGALIILIAALIYQANSQISLLRDRSTIIAENTAQSIKLTVSYPQTLHLENPVQIGEPLIISLSSIASKSQTIIPSGTTAASAPPTLLAVPAATVTPSSSAIAAPTSNAQILLPAFIVSIEPSKQGIVFTDKDNNPITPRTVVTPGLDAPATVTYFIHAAADNDPDDPVTFTPHLFAQDGNEVGLDLEAPNSPMGLESTGEAAWRHFWDLLLGPSTPLLAAAAALAAFLIRDLEAERERKRKQRDVIEPHLKQISHLYVLAYENPARAVSAFVEIGQKIESGDPEFQDDQIISHLKEIQSKCPPKIQVWVSVKRGLPKGSLVWAELVQILGLSKFAECCYELFEDLDAPEGKQLCDILSRFSNPGDREKFQEYLQGALALLQRQQDPSLALELLGGQTFIKNLNTVNAGASNEIPKLATQILKTIDNRGRFVWPPLLPAPRNYDRESFHEARLLGLVKNPFGSLVAESDPLVLDANFYPAILQPAQGPARGNRHAILFGKPGSGRTAAALLLYHDCRYPPSVPREREAFPVLYRPSFSATHLDNENWIKGVATVIAQSLIQFIARNPLSFLTLSQTDQAAIVNLLNYHSGGIALLTDLLLQAGTRSEAAGERLVFALKALSQKHPVPGQFDEIEIIDLLAKARPDGFSLTYVLVDLPKEFGETETTTLLRVLQPLIDLAIWLKPANVFLKMFLPEVLSEHLWIDPEITVGNLEWTLKELKGLLIARLQAAGSPDLYSLCGPDVAHDPTDLLVNATNCLPRELIARGNKLLNSVGRHPDNPRILDQDIKTALQD